MMWAERGGVGRTGQGGEAGEEEETRPGRVGSRLGRWEDLEAVARADPGLPRDPDSPGNLTPSLDSWRGGLGSGERAVPTPRQRTLGGGLGSRCDVRVATTWVTTRARRGFQGRRWPGGRRRLDIRNSTFSLERGNRLSRLSSYRLVAARQPSPPLSAPVSPWVSSSHSLVLGTIQGMVVPTTLSGAGTRAPGPLDGP